MLLIVVWRFGQGPELWKALQDANWLLLGLTALLIVPVIHLKVVRWRALLAARGHRYPLGRTYVAVLSSLYLGMLTPGRVGDVLRIQYVRREIETPYTDGLAATIMDRFCDLYVLAGVATVGMVHFADILRSDIARVTWFAVGVALLVPLLLIVKGLASFWA